MTSIEKLERILIEEEIKKENYNSTKENLYENIYDFANRNKSPDMVRKPFGKTKPLDLTLWKEIYIKPQLEYDALAIQKWHTEGAMTFIYLIMLSPLFI